MLNKASKVHLPAQHSKGERLNQPLRNMADSPSRPQRPTSARTLSQRAGNLSADAVATPSVKMGTVGTPANMVDNSLMKFAQLILFGVAMLGIWAGLLNIAFPGGDQETGQSEFLVLGFGGLFSGLLAISLVEFQRRKGGNELQNVHDYMPVSYTHLTLPTKLEV